MVSKLHQNAVITGCVDCFCLVCESHLRSEEDAASHLQKPVHNKNLGSCPYLQKFANDHIRKVKKGYYCEFCNLLLQTAAKVGLHVLDEAHKDNKGAQLIKRCGNYIIAYENILITEQAWNGLIMDTCAICNIEFHNLKLHIADQKHILNLIQKRIEFTDGITVYRKIDNTSFHCLICNDIFALNTVPSHSGNETHTAQVDKCQKLYQANNNTTQSVNNFEIDKADTVKTNIGDCTSKNEKKNVNVKVNNNQGPQRVKSKQQTNIAKETTNNTNNNSILDTDLKIFSADMKDDLTVEETKSTQGDKTTDIKTEKANAEYVFKDIHQETKEKIPTEEKCMDSLFEHVSEFQKNGVNIDFQAETAFCKKCFISVDLDIKKIKKHIEEHKSTPKKEITANTGHTLNVKHSRIALNSRENDDETASKPAVNFDLNHNISTNKAEKETMTKVEEEMIKIDLTKTEDYTEEDISKKAVIRYTPGASATEPQKLKEGTSQNLATKEVQDMNDPAEFAQLNNITYNKGVGNAYCRICNTRVPAPIKSMKEHVGGMSHKTKVARIAEIKRAKSVIPKKVMGKFVHQKSTVMNVLGVDDVILNDKYCMTRMSYYMITEQNRLRCQACEVNLMERDVIRHVDGVFHERAMERTPVVTNLDGEFVREVRPGLFHCGFCNHMVGAWEHVAPHLQCTEHQRMRTAAGARLREHLPPILAHRVCREDTFRRGLFDHLWPFW